MWKSLGVNLSARLCIRCDSEVKCVPGLDSSLLSLCLINRAKVSILSDNLVTAINLNTETQQVTLTSIQPGEFVHHQLAEKPDICTK